jgi:hypothetical protein
MQSIRGDDGETETGGVEEDLLASIEEGKGYYPAQIGSTFQDGQFVVIRKLRVDPNASVWLVRDMRE